MNEADFASYSNNKTPYVVGDNVEDVIITLQNEMLFVWISFHLMIII